MSELESDEQNIYELLANERRRLVLECLLRHEGSLSLGELVDQVTVRETGTSPPSREKRHSVYTALVRTHLPQLDSFGIVRYDSESREVELGRRAHNLHLEVVPQYEISWGEYYLALGVLALLTVSLASLGVPLVDLLSPVIWTVGYFGLYIASALYHLRSPNRETIGPGWG